MKLTIQSVTYAFAILISINVQFNYGLRILGIFPLPMRSHQTMCEVLMKGLAAKGHQVDVYSHFPQKIQIPNYTDYSLEDSIPKFLNNVNHNVISTVWTNNIFYYWFNGVANNLCKIMDQPIFQKLLKNPPQDPPYDLVIVELCVAYCYMAWGRHLNVPLISISTSPLSEWNYDAFGSPLNLATDGSIVLPFAAPMNFFERFQNVFRYYEAIYNFDYHVRSQDKYVEKYFGPGYPSVAHLQKDVSLLLVNYDMTLHGIKPFAPVIQPVGGLHIVDLNETLPEVVQKWLDESKNGCIYFSFGSMARIETFPRHVLDIFYKAFKNIAPVRVLLKIAKPEELPPGLPSNVMTYPWLPQIQVLKHKNIKAFVTHGGLMSTLESIYYGVPLVGIPLFYDQPFNIAGYVKRNIAINVDINKITEESLTNSLKEILGNPLYRNSMQKVSDKFKDRPLNQLETSIFWIEYIHRHGKNALRSPVVDMPWWQASLLDVYSSIAILVILILYIIKVVLNKFFSFIRLKFYKNCKEKKN